jgi:Na+-translocating ferredoxin:NAD+ oxidoreductase RnfC subunit
MALNKKSIADAAREAGVVGAGGAGFPTQVKLQANVDTVIANGAECEPLLANDQALMVGSTDDFVRGLDLAATATGAKRKVVALKGRAGDRTRSYR